jgi:LacI family transcriptional regulator
MPAPPPRSRRQAIGSAATLREVALLAGVSIATASRVLTGVRPASPQTHARVQAAAAQLDYRPSALGRALRRRTSQMLGLLVTDIENPYFPEIVRAVEDAARERGYGLLLCSAADDPQRELTYLDVLLQGRVDGIIVASARVGSRHAELLRAGHIPVVLVNSEARGSGLPSISSDNRGGARLATCHLLDCGHRRIGHITAPATNAAARQRLAGIRDGLIAAGRDPATLRIAVGDGHVAGGEQAMRELLDLDPPISAVLCYNDLTAIGALRAIRAAGLAVPADVSVVGFDDIDLAAWTDPPLTTVAQQKAEMGRLAVAALTRRLASPGLAERPRSIHLPTRLVVRGSTGPRS